MSTNSNKNKNKTNSVSSSRIQSGLIDVSTILFKWKHFVTQSNKSIGETNLSSDEALANNIIQIM